MDKLEEAEHSRGRCLGTMLFLCFFGAGVWTGGSDTRMRAVLGVAVASALRRGRSRARLTPAGVWRAAASGRGEEAILCSVLEVAIKRGWVILADCNSLQRRNTSPQGGLMAESHSPDQPVEDYEGRLRAVRECLDCRSVRRAIGAPSHCAEPLMVPKELATKSPFLVLGFNRPPR